MCEIAAGLIFGQKDSHRACIRIRVVELPLPLLVDVCKGDADIKVVLNDLMALTKLNYNACIFADGQPVTLRFADAIGEILTSGPFKDVPPLPFKLYI